MQLLLLSLLLVAQALTPAPALPRLAFVVAHQAQWSQFLATG
jgi:hypothetical protein